MKDVGRVVLYIVLGLLLLFAFNYMMERDADQICDQDAGAFQSCEWRGNR